MLPDRPAPSQRALRKATDHEGSVSIVETNGRYPTTSAISARPSFSIGDKPIPKLIIKIGKKDDANDAAKHKHKKKKKHKKKERDEEWEGSDFYKKKKKKGHRRDRE